MNDEFLYRLRKDPPPEFAARLKARLDLRASPSLLASRSFLTRSVVAALLIGGSALAIAWFSFREVPSAAIEPVRGQENAGAPVTPKQPPDAAASRSPILQGQDESTAAQAPEQFQSPPATVSAGQPARTSVVIVSSATTDALAKQLLDLVSLFLDLVKPRIETVDSASVFASFCNGRAGGLPDMAIAGRRITPVELANCRSKGIRVVEAKIGYQALVLTGAVMGSPMKLSARDVFNALAKQVPDPLDPTRLIDNPNWSWNQVNEALEDRRIEVLGPPRGSPMQEAFAALVLEAGCDTYSSIKVLKDTDAKRYERICHTLREDGAYKEIAEVTNILVTQTLWAEPNALAIFEYGHYWIHRGELIGSLLEYADAPTSESISTGTYPVSRPLYLYVNAASARRNADVRKFLDLVLNDRLHSRDLIPLDEAQRRTVRNEVMRLKELNL